MYTQFTRSAWPVALLLSLILSSCEVSEQPMPDTFYAYGSWRFDTDESQLHDGVTGTAIIELEFTREYENQYSIYGTLTYVEEEMTCDAESAPNRICPLDTCSYVGSTGATIIGVAEASESTLTVKPVWLNEEYPKEKVHAICADESEPLHETSAVYQTMGPGGAGFMDSTWTIDIEDALFIDELPVNEVTNVKAMQAMFETEVGFVEAQGLIGLYLDEP